jgi:hypothetical protein
MEGQSTPREVFRRSWLTLASEWSLAGGVSLAVGLAAHYFSFQGGWERLGLMALPMIWAVSRTIQGACQTWTATGDGHLIVRKGFLLRTCQDIRLASVRQVKVETPPLVGWLNIGHISFLATDSRGQVQSLRWTWLERHHRLYEIIQTQGQLPVGRPSQWQPVFNTGRRPKQAMEMWLTRGWVLIEEGIARLRGQWFVDDYGRFMAFCHHLLRSKTNGQWPPPRVPSAVVNRWMAVLWQAHIVVDASNGRGWRVDSAIRNLEDVRRRISEKELQHAVKQSADLRLCQHSTT